jgi:proteasome assembly chaperone (PAC2) family protein
MAAGLAWEQHPSLDRPLLVAAFSGWNDAGDAATGAAGWLLRHGHGPRVAWIDPDEYVDYQSRRPTVELTDGVTRAITWPATEIHATSVGGRDLVIVQGVEPNLRWREYCEAILEVAGETGCEMVVTLGALIGDVVHTRDIPVTGTATDAELLGRLDLTRSQYEGPTGIVGVLHDACREAGIGSVSLWAPVPHYVSSPPNPVATRALLARLGRLAGLRLDLHGLEELVDMWRTQVDRAVEDNEELEDYIRGIEMQMDAESAERHGVVLGDDVASAIDSDLDTGSLDGFTDEIEQFLREQGDARDD